MRRKLFTLSDGGCASGRREASEGARLMDLQRREREARGRWPQGCPGSTPGACVVDELEVGLGPLALAPLGLEEVAGLAQVVVVQGCLERGVRGLGEDALFLQDGEDTHGLEGKRMA